MKPPSWPQWQHSSHPIPHSVEIEHRVTVLEIHMTGQEEINDGLFKRMKWLERGLQAITTIGLTMLASTAPDKAAQIAELLITRLLR